MGFLLSRSSVYQEWTGQSVSLSLPRKAVYSHLSFSYISRCPGRDVRWDKNIYAKKELVCLKSHLSVAIPQSGTTACPELFQDTVPTSSPSVCSQKSLANCSCVCVCARTPTCAHKHELGNMTECETAQGMQKSGLMAWHESIILCLIQCKSHFRKDRQVLR